MTKLALAETLAVFASLAAITATVPAQAAESQANAVVIRHDDLNLMTPAGQRTLERRIDRAAREVCQLDVVTTGSRIRSPQSQACYEQAQRSARTSIAAAIENSRKGG